MNITLYFLLFDKYIYNNDAMYVAQVKRQISTRNIIDYER